MGKLFGSSYFGTFGSGCFCLRGLLPAEPILSSCLHVDTTPARGGGTPIARDGCPTYRQWEAANPDAAWVTQGGGKGRTGGAIGTAC